MGWLEGVLNEILINQDMGPQPALCVVTPCPSVPGELDKVVQVPCDVKDCIQSKLAGDPGFCDFLSRLMDYVNLLNTLKDMLAEAQARLVELNSAIDAIEQFLIDSGCSEFYQGNDGPGTDPQFDKDADVDPVCAVYYTQLYRLEELKEEVQEEIDTMLETIDFVQGIIDSMQQSYSNTIHSAAEECRNEQSNDHKAKTVII